MSFNPDPFNSVKEEIFLETINKVHHPHFLFNNFTVQQISTQKHSGMHLGENCTVKYHINKKINKANKGTDTIRTLNNIYQSCKTPYSRYISSVWYLKNLVPFVIT